MKIRIVVVSLLLIAVWLLGLSVGRSNAQAVKEVKVGFIEPITGPLAQDGLINMKAYQMAVDEINAAGGIKSLGGAQIKVLAGDSTGKPEVGMGEAERLMRDGAVVLIGAYQSSVTYTTTQVAEKNKTPYICSIASANSIARRGFKYLIKNSPDLDDYDSTFVEFIVQMNRKMTKKVKTIAVLYEDTLHGKEESSTIIRNAKLQNLEVVATIAYPHATSDLTSEISKVKASKADGVLASTYISDAILLTKTMEKLRYNPICYFSLAGAANPQYAKSLGPLAEGTWTNAEWNHLLKKKGVKELNERFKSYAGVNMDGFRAENYTAVYILRDALERAASLDKEKIMEALRKTNMTDHYMPYERIVFDERGKNPNVKVLVVEVRKGEYFPIYPFDYAAGEPTWPFVPWEKR